MILGSADIDLETSHIPIIIGIELVFTDVDVLFLGEEVMHINKLGFHRTSLKFDCCKGTSMFTVVHEVHIVPFGELVLVGDGLVKVSVTLPGESIVRVGTESNYTSSKCTDEGSQRSIT
jgi:hypothetical protein